MAVVVINTAGTGSWTVPAGVSEVKVECWGAGGYGDSASSTRAAVGGGGGAYACKLSLAVTPGAAIAYQVGAGASANKNTWFGSTTTVLAAGAQTSGSGTTPPNGGQASASIGDIKFSGGSGGTATTGTQTGRAGGGGGASGSPSGAGANGVGTSAAYTPGGAGGSSPNAGAGGNAGATGSPATAGQSNPNGGGGGGGGGSSNGTTTGTSAGGQGGTPGGGSGGGRNSLNGAPGQIRLTYVDPPATSPHLITSTGAGTFKVPAGVTSITVECWGGGGAGGSSSGYLGGGGGAYSASVLAVTPDEVIPYSVGAGGLSGTSNSAPYGGFAAGDTWFLSSATLLAKGGNGGGGGYAGTDGKGGLASAGVGMTRYSGGNAGGPQITDQGTITQAGGGSSASPSGAGQSAPNGAGGSSPSAGAGGAAASTQSASGVNGQSNEDGGGGGGANGTYSFGQATGAGGTPGGGNGHLCSINGPRGQIRITWGGAPSGTPVSLNSTTMLFAASVEPTYAAAREGSGINRYVSDFGWVGQYLGGTYDVNQVFASFDLASLPSNAEVTSAKLVLTISESYGSHTVEVRSSAFTPADAGTSFIPGSQLASKTFLGSTAFVEGYSGEREITLTNLSRANLASIVMHGADQRTNTPPTGDTTTRVSAARLDLTWIAGEAPATRPHRTFTWL